MIRTHRFSLALAGTLFLAALALWLSASSPGHAATAEQAQGTTVQVQGSEISWAANAACQTAPNTGFASADFGASPPGGGDLQWPVNGPFGNFSEACVLSNAGWSVDAAATDLQELNNQGTIPATNLALTALGRDGAILQAGETDPVAAAISQECDAGDGINSSYCSLGNSHTVVTSANPSPEASGFLFQYRLTVPPEAAAGDYTGSVTFTASN